MSAPGDSELLARLRELALVDPEVVVGDASGPDRLALLEALAEDLEDALARARARAAELIAAVRVGDPLTVVAAGRELRLRDGGHDLADRTREALAARARAAADLSRLDDLSARVAPRLFEVDRRLGRRPGRQQGR